MEISPKYLMILADKICERIFSEMTSYEKSEIYVKKWQVWGYGEDEFAPWIVGATM